jgi:hypothetical protein
MLKHSVIGPCSDGQYRVVYATPGCGALTVVMPCPTSAAADGEAMRLNEQQTLRQHAADEARRLCGLSGDRRA